MSRIRSDRPVDAKRALMTTDEEHSLRQSFRGSPCEACGINDDTIVGCHFNFGDTGGMGIKARGLIAGLCAECHNYLDRRQGTEKQRTWVLERLIQKMLRDRLFK